MTTDHPDDFDGLKIELLSELLRDAVKKVGRQLDGSLKAAFDDWHESGERLCAKIRSQLGDGK